MQKLLLFSALTISTMLGIDSTQALAWVPQDVQQGPPPEGGPRGGRRAPDPDRQIKMMTKRLKLSSDQQSQIKTILTDRNTQMESIRGDASLQPQDRREKMRTLMADTESKINGVLNDKQKAEFQTMQAERREHMQNRQGGGVPPQQ